MGSLNWLPGKACVAIHKCQEELFIGLRSKWREDQQLGDKGDGQKIGGNVEQEDRSCVFSGSQEQRGNGHEKQEFCDTDGELGWTVSYRGTLEEVGSKLQGTGRSERRHFKQQDIQAATWRIVTTSSKIKDKIYWKENRI